MASAVENMHAGIKIKFYINLTLILYNYIMKKKKTHFIKLIVTGISICLVLSTTPSIVISQSNLSSPGLSSFDFDNIDTQVSRLLGDLKTTEYLSKRKVVVIGASGYLGKKIYQTFKDAVPNPDNVIGTYYSKQNEGLYRLDVTNDREVKAFMEQFQPDMVIYAAGLTKPEIVDTQPEIAENLNANVLGTIAEHFQGHFVYISTDYVFDGESPPYSPQAVPNPLNKYATTKMHGEERTRSNFSKHSILRVGLLYGHNDKDDKITFVRDMVKKFLDGEDIQADDDQIRHPMLIDEVAKYILMLMIQESFGTFQLNSEESVTKYQWANIIADLLCEVETSLQSQEIKGKIVSVKSASQITTKPHNAHMVNSAIPNALTHGTRQNILSVLRMM